MLLELGSALCDRLRLQHNKDNGSIVESWWLTHHLSNNKARGLYKHVSHAFYGRLICDNDEEEENEHVGRKRSRKEKGDDIEQCGEC